MASFTIEIQGGAEIAWPDAAGTSSPSRLNPQPQHPHGYRAVSVPGSIIVYAIVGGVTGPLDSDLVMAGRTFTATIARWSGSFPPVVTQGGGQSSRVNIVLGADNVGHHQLLLTLSGDGGSVGVPFDGR